MGRTQGPGRGWGMVGVALTVSGCAVVGPDYVKPAAIVPAQYKEIKGWKFGRPRDEYEKGAWWEVFHDPELSTLEAQVAISNQTLKADEANYREAQALIAQARAQLFPTLTLNASIERGNNASGLVLTTLSGQANASWTPDLWGKVRRTIEGQAAGAQASAADLANAKLSAQSALATAYYQLRETDSLHDLLDNTVKQYKRALDITQNQYQAGTAARSDVITAQALVLAAQAQEINTEVARGQFEHAIAVLIGRPPAGLSIRHGALTHDPPHIPLRLPSTLLERRPDIAAAERTMQQQNAQIGVAIAAYYPDITLTGLIGGAGTLGVKSIAGANPVWSIAASFAQTLFNGGLTDAQVAAARATYEASVATYRQTVLAAFGQVEDQLVAIRVLASEESVQVEAVKAAEQAVQIALNEYRAGTQNFTTVVTAEATALSDEESLLSTREQRVEAAVALVVALGGGWTEAQLPAETQ
ncbi:MAG TPA: efflux transporter outer membrane subunit [Roseiarcus sp.]|jgi:NodT family efflux transporter outer membrane factor (OMF) lipoprotein|nr:efflux transporter outer membrane subunit [Roseiarcus sp.]